RADEPEDNCSGHEAGAYSKRDVRERCACTRAIAEHVRFLGVRARIRWAEARSIVLVASVLKAEHSTGANTNGAPECETQSELSLPRPARVRLRRFVVIIVGCCWLRLLRGSTHWWRWRSSSWFGVTGHGFGNLDHPDRL